MNQKGLTLIEVLVGTFLLSTIAVGAYGAFSFGIRTSTHNRLRTQAAAIGEETIESIRAMDYDDVGIEGGIPNGTLSSVRETERNGTIFTVNTSVRYIDDAYDQEAPTDTVPSDYKQTEVSVQWPVNLEKNVIKLSTVIAPPRIETTLGTGVFILNTVDEEDSVPNCTVHIVNNDVSPPVDLETETDATGSLTLPGALPSTNSYEVTVSKSGYETIETYPPYPDSSFNPLNSHLSITENEVTTGVFVTGLLSQLRFHFIDTLGNGVASLPFSLEGGRIIGTTVDAEPLPVYIYDEPSLTSDTSGDWEDLAIGTGPYFLTTGGEDYELILSDPILPVELAPNSEMDVDVIMGDKTEDTFIFYVKEIDGEEELPISEATVKIEDSGATMSQETLTNVNGLVYFPQLEDPAIELDQDEDYTITVTKEGYDTEVSTQNVSNITRIEILMTKI